MHDFITVIFRCRVLEEYTHRTGENSRVSRKFLEMRTETTAIIRETRSSKQKKHKNMNQVPPNRSSGMLDAWRRA